VDLDVGVVLQEEAFIAEEYEQLWRDLFMGCFSLFYHLFYKLEDNGWLNDSNDTDLLALHYVFIPRINLQLEFCQTYSHHRLRTARNQSPYQLWVRGFNQQSGDDAALQGVLGDALVRISNCSTIDMLSLSKVWSI